MKTQKDLALPDEVVMHKIYYIRGQKVMLDRDMAGLYGVTTGNFNKAVARNLKRFPEDFAFRLNDLEFKNLIFQIGTSSWGGTRKSPMVFTEQGVAMLSGILNSDRAVLVNIAIMRAFIKMRQVVMDNTELRLAIEEIRQKTKNNTKNIEVVFQYLDELLDKKENPEKRKQIGYPKPN